MYPKETAELCLEVSHRTAKSADRTEIPLSKSRHSKMPRMIWLTMLYVKNQSIWLTITNMSKNLTPFAFLVRNWMTVKQNPTTTQTRGTARVA